MKIVYSHLLNFLEKKPSLEELSDKLFQLGHEHEIEGEVIDLEITPNRGDCLSLKGIARDLSHFYKASLEKEIYDAAKVKTFSFPKDLPKFDCLIISVDHKQFKIRKKILTTLRTTIPMIWTMTFHFKFNAKRRNT